MTKTWIGACVSCRIWERSLGLGLAWQKHSADIWWSKSNRHGLSQWACSLQPLEENSLPAFSAWYFSVIQADVWQQRWQTWEARHSQMCSSCPSLTEPGISCVLGSVSLSPLPETRYHHQLPDYTLPLGESISQLCLLIKMKEEKNNEDLGVGKCCYWIAGLGHNLFWFFSLVSLQIFTQMSCLCKMRFDFPGRWRSGW